MKKIILFTCAFLFYASLFYSPDVLAKKSVKKRILKPTSKIEEVRIEVPQIVVNALAKGDLNDSIILMREQKPTPKMLYLMREVSRISKFTMSDKPKNTEAHKVYQNVAVAYHNLYLFLKNRNVDQREFLDNAHKYYSKAKRAATVLHKSECVLLDAALTASSGDKEKAEKMFKKVDELHLRGDFESTEYLAAYYAAIGDTNKTVENLKLAFKLNPGETLTWLAVGDDFNKIADDPEYKELLITWKAEKAEKGLTLSIPKSGEPKLEVTDESGLFRPQKTMPHYDLKKAKKSKSKAATTKSAAKKKSVKKK